MGPHSTTLQCFPVLVTSLSCIALHISNDPALCSELRLWPIFATPQKSVLLYALCPLPIALWDVLWLLCAQYVGAVLCCAQLRKHIPQQTVGTLLPPGWSALPTRECQTSIYPLSRTMLYFLFICPFICLYRSLSEYCSLCVNGINKCVPLFSGFKLSGFNFGCGFGCWFWSYIYIVS